MNKIIFLSLIFVSHLSGAGQPLHIIFDLPKTLLEPDELGFFKDVVGIWDGAAYTLGGNNPWHLEELMYKTLDSLGSQKVSPELRARSHKERVLPQILCDGLAGLLTQEEAIKRVKTHIRKLNKENFFQSRRERKLITRIAQAIFTPQELANHTIPLRAGVDFVAACAAQYGSQRLYILANWDAYSMKILQESDHAQRLMHHFLKPHIFISGTMKMLLPQPGCFERLVKQYQLEPQQCVFISGIKHHIEAARAFGMQVIFIQNGNFAPARVALGL